MLVTSFLKNDKHDVFDPFIILFTGFVGGYTVMNFPKKVLNFFASPVGQFLAYISILYIYYKDVQGVTITHLILEAILYVIILQIITFVLHILYNEDTILS